MSSLGEKFAVLGIQPGRSLEAVCCEHHSPVWRRQSPMVDMSSIEGHGTLGDGDDLPAQGAFTHSAEPYRQVFARKSSPPENKVGDMTKFGTQVLR